jgi:uncharacterized protein YkwD
MRNLTVGVIVVAILLVTVGWAATAHFPVGPGASTVAGSASSTSASDSSVDGLPSTSDSNAGDWLTDSPIIVGQSAKIDFPPDYLTLENFTLAVINQDRVGAGLSPVVVSSVLSGQQHADSMAYYGYFSHWDNQGYKPYMRYTLLGGTGSVEENAALNYCSDSTNATGRTPAPCTLETVENAITDSEWVMMNNDSACCGNGHRDNILDALHNKVSIGVAYNSTTVFFVEDFEDSYLSSESLQLSGSTVTFNGTLQQDVSSWMSRVAGAEISVFYDPIPSGISVSSLDDLSACAQNNELNESAACQYEGAYTPGTVVSTVFPPCPTGEDCVTDNGTYTYAQTWQVDSGSFDVTFSLSSLIAAHGSGVYTIYLWPAERLPEAITSLSIFAPGP